jgi:predicted ATPase
VSRAQAAQPSFALTEENAPTILAICRRLGGLPLAIELVAARINLLPPAALLHRLDARLDLLTSGARDVPACQQTLRDGIAWSYDLLPAAEQRLFRRLGVFAGGWTLDAAEAVGNAAGGAPSPLLTGLGALLDKSLVVSRPAGGSGEPRYGTLETIREYALERLDESGEAPVIRQHGTFYLALAETAAPHFHGPEQKGWLDRLEAEYDNVRAALAWSLSPGAEAESRGRWLLGVQLASALGRSGYGVAI